MGHHAPWLVRIEDEAGVVHGAGTLLSGELVLTCAHVVEDAIDAQGRVRIRVKGRSSEVHLATVLPECWHPREPDHTGDVAVLMLDRPLVDAPRARLRSTWLRDEPIEVFGFPEKVDNGLSVQANIRSDDFAGERAQLDASGEQRIHQGFSGAAALGADGAVLGVVASVWQPSAETAWMITVRTLRRYAGAVVEEYLTHRASSDPPFVRPNPRSEQAFDGTLALAVTRRLTDWLVARGPGGVCAVGGGVAQALVSHLVGLTVPQYRRALPARTVADAPEGTVPRLGAVHAAVDAAGKDSEQVAQQLAQCLNLAEDGNLELSEQLEGLGSAVVIAVGSIDASQDPVDLYVRVLAPIAVLAPDIRVRLLLGYRAEPPHFLRGAVAARLTRPAVDEGSGPADGGTPIARLSPRIARLAALSAAVERAEREAATVRARVAPRVLGVPETRVLSTAALGVRARILGDLEAAADDPAVLAWLPGELEACEGMAERALGRAQRQAEQMRELLGERDRLRSRLGACRARAVARGLAEEFGESYERARRRLYSELCDLRPARLDVAEYCDAVHGELERGKR
jgi:Trypsin-like peptidase domain